MTPKQPAKASTSGCANPRPGPRGDRSPWRPDHGALAPSPEPSFCGASGYRLR